MGQGTLILGFFVIGFAFAALYLAKLVFKDATIVNKLKEKLMWSPVCSVTPSVFMLPGNTA